jgi:hypothetical protein
MLRNHFVIFLLIQVRPCFLSAAQIYWHSQSCNLHSDWLLWDITPRFTWQILQPFQLSTSSISPNPDSFGLQNLYDFTLDSFPRVFHSLGGNLCDQIFTVLIKH